MFGIVGTVQEGPGTVGMFSAVHRSVSLTRLG